MIGSSHASSLAGSIHKAVRRQHADDYYRDLTVRIIQEIAAGEDRASARGSGLTPHGASILLAVVASGTATAANLSRLHLKALPNFGLTRLMRNEWPLERSVR